MMCGCLISTLNLMLTIILFDNVQYILHFIVFLQFTIKRKLTTHFFVFIHCFKTLNIIEENKINLFCRGYCSILILKTKYKNDEKIDRGKPYFFSHSDFAYIPKEFKNSNN